MQFSRDWLAQYVEVRAGRGGCARCSPRSGSSVEHVDDRGRRRAARRRHHRQPARLHEPPRARARDRGAAGRAAAPPRRALRRESGAAASSLARVEVAEAKLCPRYSARVLEDVRLGPSPDWLVRRLEAVGARSINNVVDVTNFVLWELGQPLHAFDLDTLAAATIVVRLGRRGREAPDPRRRGARAARDRPGDRRRRSGRWRSPASWAGSPPKSPRRRAASCSRARTSTARRVRAHREARSASTPTPAIASSAAPIPRAPWPRSIAPRRCSPRSRVLSFAAAYSTWSIRPSSFAARSRSRRDASMPSPASPTTAPISRAGSPVSASRCSTPAPTPGRCECRAGVDSTSSAPKTSTRRRCAFAASTRSRPRCRRSTAPTVRRRRCRSGVAWCAGTWWGRDSPRPSSCRSCRATEDARYPLAKTNGNAPAGAAAGGAASSGPVELANPLSEQYAVLRRSMLPGLVDTALFNLQPRRRRGAPVRDRQRVPRGGGRVARAGPRWHRRHALGRSA